MIWIYTIVSLLSGFGIGYYYSDKKNKEYIEFLNEFYREKIKKYQEGL